MRQLLQKRRISSNKHQMKPSPLGTTLKLFKDILSRRQKYLSKEYQAYGLELAK